ncbi:glycosyl transferase family 1 [Lusitaniella coriacea LEGE 07157]|uniref:Glycosyl transferase family 1 n=1 Tax=Lusitaniella coriacea LEGE 07157 TaxID=945747 RepID=A0A8J7DVU0_9CYAN|nr:glycosyl transferase family 1 [Lusitaniella coriacea]MBE9115970.1 glycosyl transferase family 1 [Lusitaniella coriacea LEGE 07157]
MSNRLINLIVFPDWTQWSDAVGIELGKAICAIEAHPNCHQITLLIETSGILEEEANLLLSGVVMNLLLEEVLEGEEMPEIALVKWGDAIAQQSHALIILSRENDAIIPQTLPSCTLEEVSTLPLEPLFASLGDRLFQQGNWQGAISQSRISDAIAQYELALETHFNPSSIYANFAECYRMLQQHELMLKTLATASQLYPKEGHFYFAAIVHLQNNGLVEDAIAIVNNASQNLPQDYTFTLLKNLILPAIYQNPADIEPNRQRFIKGLEALIQETSFATPEERSNALAGICRLTNFYLAYQAQNDVELQCKYGNLVHRIVTANYPQWREPLSMPALTKAGKIRIGYVSAYLHSYSGTLWLTGWLKQHNREQFEVYCYYTSDTPDPVTQQFREYSDVFHHIPHNLAATCEQIRRDRLHILIFPEIGMDAPTFATAGLRLAPIQCTAWGHPVTTGLPTIDYFLSSELMEPKNAQEHYSEKLILLPNIGVAYPQPTLPPLIKSRAELNLPEDAILYLCCQAPFKYLPQYDYILAEIALRVPQAQFIFLRGEILKPRLDRAFATVGLNYQDYCLFLTIPERLDYLLVNLHCDVYLDTLTWSGGNTSLEAIACYRPIVTSPGEFMRGRHTDSFLKMIGVTETIARDEAEYIEIAVKLGRDRAWREEIETKMKERRDRLFDDPLCVRGLEEFYQEIVAKNLN